jgi:hypothetical protein
MPDLAGTGAAIRQQLAQELALSVCLMRVSVPPESDDDVRDPGW